MTPESSTDVCARVAPLAPRKTEQPAGKPVSMPTNPNAAGVTRCAICGAGYECAHPDANRIRWTRKRAIAWTYIDRAGDAPVRHFRDNPEEAERYWPGVDAGDCLYALQLYRQWKGEPKPL